MVPLQNFAAGLMFMCLPPIVDILFGWFSGVYGEENRNSEYICFLATKCYL